jgi:formyl-CoA transferase
MPGALNGVKVLDLSRVLAGPYCTQILGDMGAEIIKVEQPGSGDGTRAWGPPYAGGEAAYYLCVNRNKRSITVNLKHPKGLAIIRRLVKEADVLVENFKTGETEALGLSYDELKHLNPHLIYCSITGYGSKGPYRERPGYDFVIQAEAGIMSITGEPDGEPMKVGVAIVDINTGLFATNAILAALFAREREPERQGQKVEVSLYECAIAWLANVGSNYLVSGKVPPRYGNAHANVVPYQTFHTGDYSIAVGIGTDLQFARFCQMAGHPEIAQDERFKTNDGRVRNRLALLPILQEIFLTRNAGDWQEMLQETGIPFGSINTLDRVFSDPHTLALEIVQEIEHPTIGKLPVVRSPINMSETPTRITLAPPLLGQHTEEILKEYGYTLEEIQVLRAEKAI